jgi:hypothetical protein
MNTEPLLILHIGKLPGSNLIRSSVFLVLVLLLWLCLDSAPAHIPSALRTVSMVVLCFTAILIVISMSVVIYVDVKQIDWIHDLFPIFCPKVLISFSVFLFFIVVCLWIFVLGGIIRSPFGDLLTVSPIYLIWQSLRDRDVRAYNRFYGAWSGTSQHGLAKDKRKELYRSYLKIVRALDISPLWVILVTVSVVEVGVRLLGLHRYFLGDNNSKVIFDTTWYIVVSYVVFVVAVTSTLSSVYPEEFKKQFDRLLTGRLGK